MSFVQISSVEAQELIRDLPHNEMKTYICEEPINIRFGEEKLLAKAFTMIGRDIQYGESFFFINKALNHFKIMYKSDNGIAIIERKRVSGQFKLPPVESMAMSDLMSYLDGNAILH